MIAAVAAAMLALSSPLHAQEFAAEMGAAHDIMIEAKAGQLRLMTHEHGILQQINAALAHLTAVSKPAVAMVLTEKGAGTGFMVDASGLLITNAHVVLDTGLNGGVRIIFSDGTQHNGAIVAVGSMGTDENPLSGRDLAIIKMSSQTHPEPWPVLQLGDAARIQEGHMVAMMGYPLAGPFTVTQGVIGGLEQREGGMSGFPVKFVQSDAAINHGNSGGPLMTMDGKVVGVNTLGFATGIAFSVGVDAVDAFLKEYKKRGAFSDGARAAMPLPSRPRLAEFNQDSCPTLDALARPWVEHTGSVPQDRLEEHLRAASDGAAALQLSINVMPWWIGVSRRGRGDSEGIGNPGCFVLGSAAFYDNGSDRAPTVDFVKVVGTGAEMSLSSSLIELRWYDPKDDRKHRWFNTALAARLGWDEDGRGAPTDTPRPIPLPDSINELF